MALDEDDSTVEVTSPAGNFHQHFRRGIATLQERIDSLLLSDTSLSNRQAIIDTSMVGIAKLSTELADASGELPSYDQRSYNQAIKSLNDKLAVVRASHAPKTKFSFKNKRLAAPSSEANSVNTSRSVTPTHLQDPESQSRGRPTPAFAPPPSHVLAGQHGERHEETSRYTDDDNQWILLNAKKDAYVSWPPSNMVEDDPAQLQHGKTCIVSEISGSIVKIDTNQNMPSPSALTLNATDQTLILAADIRGAAHITGLRNSVLVLSCHQFRMHKSNNVDVYLYCNNRPIIEDCTHIRFARIPPIFRSSGLGTEHGVERMKGKPNMFDQVDDFKWLRAEASPNWSTLQEDETVQEQTWEEILERLRKCDGGANEALSPESITQILQSLKIENHS